MARGRILKPIVRGKLLSLREARGHRRERILKSYGAKSMDELPDAEVGRKLMREAILDLLEWAWEGHPNPEEENQNS